MSKKGKKSISKSTAKLKQTNKQSSNQSSKKKLCVKVLSHTWTQLSIFFGIVGFLFLVYPRISVDPGESLNSYMPFKAPFIIKNDGYLPLYDVNFSAYVVKIEDYLNNTSSDNNYRINDKIPKLRANESTTIFFQHLSIGKTMDTTLKYAEIYVDISYRPSFIPYNFTDRRRFKMQRKQSGEYIWLKFYSQK